MFFGKSILFIVYYLSAKFQVNSTSQSKDTLGGPLGGSQHLKAHKSPVLIGLSPFYHKNLFLVENECKTPLGIFWRPFHFHVRMCTCQYLICFFKLKLRHF